MKNTVSDSDKLADKLEEDDKSTIEEAIKETLDWLDDNQDADGSRSTSATRVGRRRAASLKKRAVSRYLFPSSPKHDTSA